MELEEAIGLIKPACAGRYGAQTWADLGCGDGLFTRALAALLPYGSVVYAIDKSPQRLASAFQNNKLEFIQMDFTSGELPLAGVDGFLMANSLHFVKKKNDLLIQLRGRLKTDGQLLIIEYELQQGNAWVPYPITYASLKLLLGGVGFEQATVIGERQSVYGNRKMYACLATRGH